MLQAVCPVCDHPVKESETPCPHSDCRFPLIWTFISQTDQEEYQHRVEQARFMRAQSGVESTEFCYIEPHTGMKFSFISSGSFQMGDLFEEGTRHEKHIRTVELTDFWLGQTPVTQEQWEKIMDNNPSFYQGANRPVEQVNWEDVQSFLQQLNAQHSDKPFHLPSEAQWEYAAREGGKKIRFGNGSDIADSSQMNFNATGNSQPYSVAGMFRDQTTEVMSFSPNSLNLYDMSGNVWEWIEDIYTDDYANVGTNNPIYEGTGSRYVIRGGSWYNRPQSVRCTNRSSSSPAISNSRLGFRLLRKIESH